MINSLAKLSVLACLLIYAGTAGADSFSLSVKASACENALVSQSRSEVRYNAYDKAAFLAVKSSPYVRHAAASLDDHSFDILAYRLADKALNDIAIITSQEDENKICLEVSGVLDKQKTDDILRQNKLTGFNPDNVATIAREVNAVLPKSMYETDSAIPLIYIKDIEFYNHKTSSLYTKKLSELLAFEPRVLVTENEELADYLLVPKLALSKIEPINAENSRYSMSVVVELQKKDGKLVDSEQQNRYIIIENSRDKQDIAQKLLAKLLEDAINALSGKLNSLLKD